MSPKLSLKRAIWLFLFSLKLQLFCFLSFLRIFPHKGFFDFNHMIYEYFIHVNHMVNEYFIQIKILDLRFTLWLSLGWNPLFVCSLSKLTLRPLVTVHCPFFRKVFRNKLCNIHTSPHHTWFFLSTLVLFILFIYSQIIEAIFALFW